MYTNEDEFITRAQKPRTLSGRIFKPALWLAFWITLAAIAFFIWPEAMMKGLTTVYIRTVNAVNEIAGANLLWRGLTTCGFVGLYVFGIASVYNSLSELASFVCSKINPCSPCGGMFSKAKPCNKMSDTLDNQAPTYSPSLLGLRAASTTRTSNSFVPNNMDVESFSAPRTRAVRQPRRAENKGRGIFGSCCTEDDALPDSDQSYQKRH